MSISIHAPTRGATSIVERIKVRCKISIHAPTRGATCSGTSSGKIILYFNPRSHEGSDVLLSASPSSTRYFNPRSHEGSDLNLSIRSWLIINFNPRSHEGSDGSCPGKFVSSPRFQSTLPRGERRVFSLILSFILIFQSTLPRGERQR